ncbi:MAG: CHASE2 domain-containing protein, partial [Nodularia sp. (in: cyanobacteria)]|nr:CHASE2 domain-containing protein [Nodularia sp. (in: cyanobacteria)]
MIKHLEKSLFRLILKLKQTFGQGHKALITSVIVAVGILILRSVGLLQSLELAALDQLFHLRPEEQLEPRITIVAIDEASLKQIGSWPIPDGDLADLLQKIQAYKPRAIGLDIYRNFPVKYGYEKLAAAYRS